MGPCKAAEVWVSMVLQSTKESETIREARERNEDPERTGVYTTGIVSKAGDHEIVLFFTGLRHAGENLQDVPELRDPKRGPPIQMSDGLSRNLPGELETSMGGHRGRRR